MGELVKVKIENNIAVVTLDSPPVNALSPALLKELKAEFEALDGNAEARAVVITGAGNHAFCAGADVKELAGASPDDAKEIVKLGQDTFATIEDRSKPVIAAINNLALGGGCELAMSCDIRISSDRARFGQPEVWLGLLPAWGGSTRLPQLVGPGKAKEMIFTGQMINAQQSQRDGLVDKIVPDGEEVRAAIDIGRMIARKSAPLAVAHSKRVINENLRASSRDQAMQNEVDAAGTLAASEDLIEGITAFIEKRAPEFQGK